MLNYSVYWEVGGGGHINYTGYFGLYRICPYEKERTV
jgi:hypothetical protein